MASTAPLRMASRVSCASCRRARNSSTSLVLCGARSTLLVMASLRLHVQQLHSHHHPFVGKISDHPAQRLRQHQGRRPHNVLADCQHWSLEHVNNLQLVTIFQMLLAHVLHVADRAFGLLRSAGHEEAQNEARGFPASTKRRLAQLGHSYNSFCPAMRISRPTSTRSVLLRSPMILRSGGGRLRTSVGTARI